MPARIPLPLSRRIQKHPNLLLGKNERLANLSDVERESLGIPFRPVPDSVTDMGPWIGRLGESVSKPGCIVHGVCQGRLDEEKRLWIELGPSVEAVYGLDLAYEVARHHSAELVIWIVDNEYSIYASCTNGDPQLELEVGAALEAFISDRFDYKGLRVMRTSDAETRGQLYALVTDPEVQRAIGHKIHRPFGLESQSIWLQLEFLGTMACLLAPASDGTATWAIADHHSLRPAALASGLGRRNLDALLFWPLPGLDWDFGDGSRLSSKPLFGRRMYASDQLSGKAFAHDDLGTLAARQVLSEGATVDEVVDYLTHGHETRPGHSELSLADAIAARRQRHATTKGERAVEQ